MKEVWLEVALPVCRFSRPLVALVLRGRSPGAVALANLVLRAHSEGIRLFSRTSRAKLLEGTPPYRKQPSALLKELALK